MLASAIAWLMVVLLMPFDALGSEVYLVGSERYSALPPGAPPLAEPATVGQSVRPLTAMEFSARTRAHVPWRTSSWLPAAVDDRLYSLAVLRYRWKGNTTTSKRKAA